MLDTLATVVSILNTVHPLGLAAGLAYIIYQLVSKRGTINTIAHNQHEISSNHLSGLPEMAETLRRIETNTSDINKGVIVLLDSTNK